MPNEIPISVVMPNFNGAKYIRRALDSFVAEDYRAKELIVIDGKSTDGSHEIISEYCRKHSAIHWVDRADRGISDAINIGLEVAHGEIIGYLGSDDVLAGGAFRTIARWEPVIDFDAIFFNSYTYYVQERRCVLQKPTTPEVTLETLLANGTIVGLQNTYYRRRTLDEVKFNVENRYSMDYELLLEVARRKGMFLYVDQVATLNYFDGNISHNNDAQALEAAYVARRFCGDYTGALFGEHLLPESDRRPTPGASVESASEPGQEPDPGPASAGEPEPGDPETPPAGAPAASADTPAPNCVAPDLCNGPEPRMGAALLRRKLRSAGRVLTAMFR